MKISEYEDLKTLDNEVCCDIDRFVMNEELKRYTDVKSLLEAAEEVICQYRAFAYSVVSRIDIEKCIGRQ